MSVQILLQGKITGLDTFLVSPAGPNGGQSRPQELLFLGRAYWVTLLSELLPRVLLEEMGLSRLLLGTSSSGQFLLILPGESREAVEAFLVNATGKIGELSGGTLRLEWGITENLGDWSHVRTRIEEDLHRRQYQGVAFSASETFSAFPAPEPAAAEYFAGTLALGIQMADQAGVAGDNPARVLPGNTLTHAWPIIRTQEDSIPFARHAAMNEDGQPASLEELAQRASGHRGWGVLRGEVDNFLGRLGRASSIEEHVRLSQLYKQFFAGELEVICSMPEYFRKVTILYAGGNSFAVVGSWDALLPLAREVQRIFHLFASENLKELDGLEGKAMPMAIALAPSLDSSLGEVYEEAGRRLTMTRAERKDAISVFGNALEWKQLADAAELVEMLVRLDKEMKARGESLDLGGAYRVGARGGAVGLDRPWRFHWRLYSVFGTLPDKDFQRLRSHLIQERSRRGRTRVRLRPSGQAALQWARLAIGE